MSLFDFVDDTTKPRDGSKKPAAPKPPAKKPPTKKAKPSTKSHVQEEDEISENIPEILDSETAVRRGSVLKDAGLVKYSLACEKCKFKKDVMVAGEPKPHHLLCKKCGSSMKVLRRK